MRTILLTLCLAFAAVPAFAADEQAAEQGQAKAENTVCVCGHAVDAARKPVTVEVDGKAHSIAACSEACEKHVKADGKKALLDIKAHSKKDEGVKAK